MRASTVAKSLALFALLAAVYIGSGLEFDTAPLQQVAGGKERTILTIPSHFPERGLTDADIVETQARPLFSASRRPFVAKIVQPDDTQDNVAEAAPPATAPKRIRLLGVNIFGESFMALVQNRESQDIRWIKPGQTFDGWVLITADKSSAHFTCVEKSNPDCKYDVELYAARQAE